MAKKNLAKNIKDYLNKIDEYNVTDETILQLIIDNQTRINTAKEAIEKDGMFIYKNGYVRSHPANKIIQESEKNIISFISKLSINPKDRIKIKYLIEHMNNIQYNNDDDDINETIQSILKNEFDEK